MNTQIGFIVKVFLLSIAIAFVIKYVTFLQAIEANNLNALIAIILPSLLMGIALIWRSLSFTKVNKSDL